MDDNASKTEETNKEAKISEKSAWDDLANTPMDRMQKFRGNLAGYSSGGSLTEDQRSKTRQAILDYEKRHGREMTDSELAAIARAEASFYGVPQRDEKGEYFNRDGTVFEKGMTDILIKEFGYDEKKSGMFTESVRNTSTRETDIAEDVLEGKDVIVNLVPMDITLNAEKAGEIGSLGSDGQLVKGFKEIGQIGGMRVYSGCRMTNGNHELDMPVCVMLFDEGYGEVALDESLDSMRKDSKAFRELVDEVIASYWDYDDATKAA